MGGGQREAKHRAAVLGGFVRQGTPVLFYHGATQAQAQPHAFGFGGEKGGEQPCGHIVGQAQSVVGHRKLQPHLAIGE